MAAVEQITVTELGERLKASTSHPVILDVREPWEFQVCALPEAKHIPMGQIPIRLGELCKESEIVVLCHHGIRSQRVAQFLKQQGFDKVFNLYGGIDAWAKEVDPAMPKY